MVSKLKGFAMVAAAFAAAVVFFAAPPASAADVVISANTEISAANSNCATNEFDKVTINAGVTVTVDCAGNGWLVTDLIINGTVTSKTMAQSTNGLIITATGDVTINAGGTINLNGKGYAGGYNSTPAGGSNAGSPPNSGGGKYGQRGNYTGGGGGGNGGIGGYGYQWSVSNQLGLGGYEQTADVLSPDKPGGGGGGLSDSATPGGTGGGKAKIIVGDVFTNDGTITANGNNGAKAHDYAGSGGGAGGSIWIDAYTVAGSGSISAVGGNGLDGTVVNGTYDFSGGGGGGGRIAVHYGTATPSALFAASSAAGGISTGDNAVSRRGASGDAGSLVFRKKGESNSEIMISGPFPIATATFAYPTLVLNNATLKPGITTTVTLTDVTITGTPRFTCSATTYNLTIATPNSGAVNLPNLAISGCQDVIFSAPNAASLDLTSARFLSNRNTTIESNTTGSAVLNSAQITGSGNATVNLPNQTEEAITGFSVTASGNVALNIGHSVTLSGATVQGGGTTAAGVKSLVTFPNVKHLTLNDYVYVDGNGVTQTVHTNVRGNVDAQELEDFTLAAGSTVNANGKGYPGGYSSTAAGGANGGSPPNSGGGKYGQRGNYTGGGGGGNGGIGGYGYQWSVSNQLGLGGYEQTADVLAPDKPGGGGGGLSDSATPGGTGGGAVKIVASGTFTFDGTITANGGNGAQASDYAGSGGGAGGSIWIDAATVTGAGSISAIGGNGLDGSGSGTYDFSGGGGSGGRIAVHYDTTTPSTIISASTVAGGISTGSNAPNQRGAAGATGSLVAINADGSSVYTTGNYDVTSTPTTIDSLTLVGGMVRFTTSAVLTINHLTVTGAAPRFSCTANTYDATITINEAGALDLTGLQITGCRNVTFNLPNQTTQSISGATISAAGSLALDLGDTVTMTGSGITGGATTAAGEVSYVTFPNVQSLTLGAVGAATTITGNVDATSLTDFTLAAGSTINASGKGYPGVAGADGIGGNGASAPANGGGKYGYWTGFPSSYNTPAGGGGYGGDGGFGANNTIGAAWQNDSLHPDKPGSSGGAYGGNAGGAGGGIVKITTSGTFTLNGTINASGANANAASSTGGGAGGSIWLNAVGTLTGTGSGRLYANGAAGTTSAAGGGGGGRIAVWYGNHSGVDDSTWASWLTTANITASGGSGANSNPGKRGTTIFAQSDADSDGRAEKAEVVGAFPVTPAVVAAGFNFDELKLIDGSILAAQDTTIGIGTITTSGTSGIGCFGSRYALTLDFPETTTTLAWENLGTLFSAPAGHNGTDCSEIVINEPQLSLSLVNTQLTTGAVFTLNSLSLDTASYINATGRGYAGGAGTYTSKMPGAGPGGGGGGYANHRGGGGGGHGGAGGNGGGIINYDGAGGPANDVLQTPTLMGSGGGGGGDVGNPGGSGGGRILITASESFTMVGNAYLKADGQTPAYGAPNGTYAAGGGGGGGTVYVNTGTITCDGTTIISAKGGNGAAGSSNYNGGGGGGGRISLTTTGGGQCSSAISSSGGTATAGNTYPAVAGADGTVSIAQNTPPTISAIADTSTDEDTVTSDIAFTVADAETPAANLTVTAASSNQVLVPDANIHPGGSGADRSVHVHPAADKSGSAVITVTVTDGSSTGSEAFTLTVSPINDAPSITGITYAPSALVNEAVTVVATVGTTDVDTGDVVTIDWAACQAAAASTGKVTVTPNGASASFVASGLSEQLPLSCIVTARDSGALTDTWTLSITWRANIAPVLSAVGNITINEDSATGAIPFTATDLDEGAPAPTVTATSSNQALVPNANVVLGGSGIDRTVTVTPVANASGSAVITLSATDGLATVTRQFTVTVTPANDAPTLTGIAYSPVTSPVQTFVEDTDATVTMNVADVDAGDSLAYSWTQCQTVAANTGRVTVTPSGSSAVFRAHDLVENITLSCQVTATDSGNASVSGDVSLTFKVDTPPTITPIADQSIAEDEGTGALAFTIADGDTAAGALVVTKASSNEALVPPANIVLGGSEGNRTVTVTPAANKSGIATITLTVSDGLKTASESFAVTVNPVNDPLTLVGVEYSPAGPYRPGQTATVTMGTTDADEGDVPTYDWSACAAAAAGKATFASEGNTATFNAATVAEAFPIACQVTATDHGSASVSGNVALSFVTGVSTISANTTISDASGNCGTYAQDNVTVNAGVTVTVNCAGSGWLVNDLTVNGTVTGATIAAQANGLMITATGNVTVGSTGIIDMNAKGYAGGAINTNGSGTGGGKGSSTSNSVYAGGGGGHGGAGGNGADGNTTYGTGGVVNDDQAEPIAAGSGGGGGGSTSGGAGGGLIRIAAGNSVALLGNALVRADGANGGSATGGNTGGGGAGGGILIQSTTIAADATATISAAGGKSGNSSTNRSGGGGAGGRIAVTSTEGSFAGTLGVTGGAPGTGNRLGAAGDTGTAFVYRASDDHRVTFDGYEVGVGEEVASLEMHGTTLRYLVAGATLAASDLTGSGAQRIICSSSSLDAMFLAGGAGPMPFDGLVSSGCRNLTIATPSVVEATYAGLSLTSAQNISLNLGDTITLSNTTITGGAATYVDGVSTIFKVTVAGTSSLTLTGDLLDPTSNPTTIRGNFESTDLVDLTIDDGSQINATGKGYAGGAVNTNGSGPRGGKGSSTGNSIYNGGGGGHGGAGGKGYSSNATYGIGGAANDDQAEPIDVGSGGGGGGSTSGGAGGGFVRIGASGTVTLGSPDLSGSAIIRVDGANGGSATGGNTGGGGAGGSIRIVAGTFNADDGAVVSAAGGKSGNSSTNKSGGGGAGGRIAVTSTEGSLVGTLSSPGGEPGTGAYLGTAGDTGTAFLRHEGDGSLVTFGAYEVGADDAVTTLDLRETTLRFTASAMLSTERIISSGATKASCASSSFDAGFSASGADGMTIDGFQLSGCRNLTFSAPNATAATYANWNVVGAGQVTLDLGDDVTLRSSTIEGGKTANDGTISKVLITGTNSLRLTGADGAPATSPTTIKGNVEATGLASLTIDDASAIDATGKGYTGGASGSPPVAGSGYNGGGGSQGGVYQSSWYTAYLGGAGGGHGGAGGLGSGSAGPAGAANDDPSAPTQPGSGGGGGGDSAGGAGGGLIRITTDTLSLADTAAIRANGANAGNVSGGGTGGGGAGGAIVLMIGNSVTSPTSVVSAAGGNGGNTPNSNGGGGGGGILVVSTQSGVFSSSTSVAGGVKGTPGNGGGANGQSGDTLVNVANNPPSMGVIADVAMDEDTASGAIAFTVADLDLAGVGLETLQVVGSSSNKVLIPDAAIAIAVTGEGNRTVILTPAANVSGSSTISLTVSDGVGGQASRSFTATVAPVNDAPSMSAVAYNPAALVNELTAVTASVTTSDIDAGDVVTVDWSACQAAAAATGKIEGAVNGNSAAFVASNLTQDVTLSCTVTVRDAALATDAEELSITWRANRAPVISAIGNVAIDEDTSTAAIPFTVTDPDEGAPTPTVTVASSNQALVPNELVVLGGSGTDRTVTVTPLANKSGTTVITITASDALSSSTRQFQVTVASVNDPLTLTGIAYSPVSNPVQTYYEGIPVTVTVTTSDADAGDTATVSWAACQAAAAATGKVTVTPSGATAVFRAHDLEGTVPLACQVTASDLGGATVTGDVSFTFLKNQKPTVSEIAPQTVGEDGTIGPIAFTIDDAETPAGSLVVTAASDNQTLVPNNRITLGGAGAARNVTIAPAANRSGTATVTVSVADGYSTATAAFLVTVNSVAEAPTIQQIATTPAALVNELTNVTVAVTATDSDEGDVVTIDWSDCQAAAAATGKVAMTAGGSSADLVASGLSENLTLACTVTATDGLLTDTGSVSITWRANVPPAISVIADQTIAEDTASDVIPFTATDADEGAPAPTVTATSTNQTLIPNGNIILGGTGTERTVKVTPAANKNGEAVITIEAADGLASSFRQFLVTVTRVNDPIIFQGVTYSPVADTYLEGANVTVTMNTTDVDRGDSAGDAPTVDWSACSAPGLTVTPVAAAVAVFRAGGLEQTLPVACQVTATDHGGVSVQGSVALTFAVNGKPTVGDIAGAATDEDTPTSPPIAFTIGDAETPLDSLTVTASSDNQALVPNGNIVKGGSGADRTLTITPAANKHGTATITVSVGDGFSTAQKSFVLTVNPVDDVPTIGATPTYAPASDLGFDAYYEGRTVTATVATADADTGDTVPDVVTADWSDCLTKAAATGGKVTVVPTGNTASVRAAGLVREESPLIFSCSITASDIDGTPTPGTAALTLRFVDLDNVENGQPLTVDGEAVIDPAPGTEVSLITVEPTGVLTLKGGLAVAGDFTINGKVIFDFEDPADVVTVHGNIIVGAAGEITHDAGNIYGVVMAGDHDLSLAGKIDVSEKGCQNTDKVASVIGPTSVQQSPSSGTAYFSACGVRKTGAGASGGSYGGVGENAVNGTAAAVYGGIFSPTYLGSAGAAVKNSDGAGLLPGAGGGRVWIRVAGTFDAAGQLLANGGNGSATGTFDKAGGGSGGAIFVEADAFAATPSFTVSAGGGSSTSGGGGGGGRIAIWYSDFLDANDSIIVVTDDLNPEGRAVLGDIVANHIYAAPGNHQRNNASGTVVLRDKTTASGKHDLIAGSNGPAGDYDNLPGDEYFQSGAVADAAGGETVLPTLAEGGAASYGFYGSLIANGAKFKWGSTVSFTGSWIVIGGGSTLIVTAEDLTHVSSQALADALAEATTLVVEGTGTKVADLSTLPANITNVTVSAAASLEFTNPAPVLDVAADRTLKVLGSLTTTDGSNDFSAVNVAGTLTAGAPTEIVSTGDITVTGVVTSSNPTANVKLVAGDAVKIQDAGRIETSSAVTLVAGDVQASGSSIDGKTVTLRVGEGDLSEEKTTQLTAMVREPTPQKLIIAPAVTANAGVDQVVTAGALFILNGMGSSEDAIDATRVWECLPDESDGGCANVARDPADLAAHPNNIQAVYSAQFVDDYQRESGSRIVTFKLTISDQRLGLSASDTTRVELMTAPPVVTGFLVSSAPDNANTSLTVSEGTQLNFALDAHTDPKGRAVSYRWTAEGTLYGQSCDTIMGPSCIRTTTEPSLVLFAPNVYTTADYVYRVQICLTNPQTGAPSCGPQEAVQVTSTNGQYNDRPTARVSQLLGVNNPNTPSEATFTIANLGSVPERQYIRLYGTATDDNTDPRYFADTIAGYRWTLTEAPPDVTPDFLNLSGAVTASQNLLFYVPSRSENYLLKFRLEAVDSRGAWSTNLAEVQLMVICFKDQDMPVDNGTAYTPVVDVYEQKEVVVQAPIVQQGDVDTPAYYSVGDGGSGTPAPECVHNCGWVDVTIPNPQLPVAEIRVENRSEPSVIRLTICLIDPLTLISSCAPREIIIGDPDDPDASDDPPQVVIVTPEEPPAENAPVVEISDGGVVDEGTVVLVNGTATEPDVDQSLTRDQVIWTQDAGPDVVLPPKENGSPALDLDDAASKTEVPYNLNPNIISKVETSVLFTAPAVDVDRQVTLQLAANGAGDKHDSKTVTFTVKNVPPPVCVGPDCPCVGEGCDDDPDAIRDLPTIRFIAFGGSPCGADVIADGDEASDADIAKEYLAPTCTGAAIKSGERVQLTAAVASTEDDVPYVVTFTRETLPRPDAASDVDPGTSEIVPNDHEWTAVSTDFVADGVAVETWGESYRIKACVDLKAGRPATDTRAARCTWAMVSVAPAELKLADVTGLEGLRANGGLDWSAAAAGEGGVLAVWDRGDDGLFYQYDMTFDGAGALTDVDAIGVGKFFLASAVYPSRRVEIQRDAELGNLWTVSPRSPGDAWLYVMTRDDLAKGVTLGSDGQPVHIALKHPAPAGLEATYRQLRYAYGDLLGDGNEHLVVAFREGASTARLAALTAGKLRDPVGTALLEDAVDPLMAGLPGNDAADGALVERLKNAEPTGTPGGGGGGDDSTIDELAPLDRPTDGGYFRCYDASGNRIPDCTETTTLKSCFDVYYKPVSCDWDTRVHCYDQENQPIDCFAGSAKSVAAGISAAESAPLAVRQEMAVLDVNGDGVDDLCYSTADYRIACSFSATGELAAGSEPDWSVAGNPVRDALGFSLSAGDVNNDGRRELIAGSPSRSAVYIFSTAGGIDAIASLADAATTLIGEAGSGFGAAIDGSHDIDADGIADIAIGAPLEDDAGLIDCGALYLFVGHTAMDAFYSADRLLRVAYDTERAMWGDDVFVRRLNGDLLAEVVVNTIDGLSTVLDFSGVAPARGGLYMEPGEKNSAADAIAAGQLLDVPMLQVKISNGSFATVHLKKLVVLSAGQGLEDADVLGVQLWYDADADGRIGAADLPVGARMAFEADDGTLTFSFDETFIGFEARRYIVAYDFSGSGIEIIDRAAP